MQKCEDFSPWIFLKTQPMPLQLHWGRRWCLLTLRSPWLPWWTFHPSPLAGIELTWIILKSISDGCSCTFLTAVLFVRRSYLEMPVHTSGNITGMLYWLYGFASHFPGHFVRNSMLKASYAALWSWVKLGNFDLPLRTSSIIWGEEIRRMDHLIAAQ